MVSLTTRVWTTWWTCGDIQIMGLSHSGTLNWVGSWSTGISRVTPLSGSSDIPGTCVCVYFPFKKIVLHKNLHKKMKPNELKGPHIKFKTSKNLYYFLRSNNYIQPTLLYQLINILIITDFLYIYIYIYI